MKRAILCMCLVMVACAPQTWHKSNASSEDFEMDKGECQARAFSIPNAPPMQIAIVFNSCMRGHGWYLSRD
jgi:hypothetical protein